MTGMRSGSCPKCESDSVYRRRDAIDDKAAVKIGRVAFPVSQDFYVCTACGYVERYLEDEGALRKIEGEDRWESAQG